MEQRKKALWLAGFVDGDGCFSFSLSDKKKKKWECVFKVVVSIKDKQLLTYIKNIIGEGTIDHKAGLKACQFRIRRPTTLLKKIVPLFKFSLYSEKAFYFNRWHTALDILENPLFDRETKHLKLLDLYKQQPPADYKAPWHTVPSKEWLCGFVEAEGSFYILNKGNEISPRYVYAFGITQKKDLHLLEFIREFFSIKAQVKRKQPKNSKSSSFWFLETTSSNSINLIANTFEGCFRGRKSLVFRIWLRSFLLYKKENNVLKKLKTAKETKTLLKKLASY